MQLVIDTSAIVAVLTSAPERAMLVRLTQGAELVAPPSVHWEIGNAFSAMLKRRRASLAQLEQALAAYAEIPLRFVEVDLADALTLADAQGLYAYDAYVIACARRQRCAILTLDRGLARAAQAVGLDILEVR